MGKPRCEDEAMETCDEPHSEMGDWGRGRGEMVRYILVYILFRFVFPTTIFIFSTTPPQDSLALLFSSLVH